MRRMGALTPAAAAGIFAMVAIIVMTGAAVLPLIGQADTGEAGLAVLRSPYTRSVLAFTLLQAGLSAILSAGLAIPIARALAHRRQFPLRGTLLRLMALPLGVPALVGVLGIIEVFGEQGWLNRLFRAAGLPIAIEIYGLGGILLAHVFFNMPLATRMTLAALDSIPAESFRLAAQLGFRPAALWRYVEWPAVRQALPGILMLVFMLCAASFTIVLTLGGGPAATTLEVAIYQSLRFDFDPERAVVLSLLQLLICLSCYLLLTRLPAPRSIRVARSVSRCVTASHRWAVRCSTAW